MKKAEFTERDIIEGCMRNNRLAQEQFYRCFFPAMFRMCMRYFEGDEDRAMSALNAGFLRAFQKIDTFESRGSLEGWVRRLVFHAIADEFASQKKYLQSVVLEETLPENKQATEHSSASLFYDDLLKIVEKLPPATCQVFKLYAIEGFSHAEISEQLSISVGTSKWHLSAAKAQMRTWLSDKNFGLDRIHLSY
jgi:RNA polymerase sigma factor (sigma-70 family)